MKNTCAVEGYFEVAPGLEVLIGGILKVSRNYHENGDQRSWTIEDFEPLTVEVNGTRFDYEAIKDKVKWLNLDSMMDTVDTIFDLETPWTMLEELN